MFILVDVFDIICKYVYLGRHRIRLRWFSGTTMELFWKTVNTRKLEALEVRDWSAHTWRWRRRGQCRCWRYIISNTSIRATTLAGRPMPSPTRRNFSSRNVRRLTSFFFFYKFLFWIIKSLLFDRFSMAQLSLAYYVYAKSYNLIAIVVYSIPISLVCFFLSFWETMGTVWPFLTPADSFPIICIAESFATLTYDGMSRFIDKRDLLCSEKNSIPIQKTWRLNTLQTGHHVFLHNGSSCCVYLSLLFMAVKVDIWKI